MAESNKLALLYTLKILKEETDDKHALTQQEIINQLDTKYGITTDRKKVSRDIDALIEYGYDIEKTHNGTKLISRTFDDTELHIIIDALLASKYITAKQTEDLIDKLLTLTSNFFKSHVNRRFFANDWEKTDNKRFFYNIYSIVDAIDRGRQISFEFYKYKYNNDSNKLELALSSSHTVSAYQLIVHNQRYYLMSYDPNMPNYNGGLGKIFYCRVDRIRKVEILEDQPALDIHKIPGYTRGIDFSKFSKQMPYMFSDDPETIVFKADAPLVDQVVDWFGKDVQIDPIPGEDKVLITLEACPNGMEVWLLQFAKSTEVIKPDSLRQKIIQDLRDITNRYGI
ncbi:MAG: WYL domain-containing protein [Clostridia bacterium]|nr:WYL domain-containing protein [Clostridia bacterium]